MGFLEWILNMFSWLFGWLRKIVCWFIRSCCKSKPPPDTCPINWQPSVLAPVFYGVRDISPIGSGGAPGTCRVFFPSLDGAVFSAPILKGCARYPLIIFCHGHCSERDHYKKWYEMPATLARSGYVVVVPHLPQIHDGKLPTAADDDLALLGAFESWMRSAWEHRDVLMPGTGVVGHSYGALLAARYAQSASVSAYASLSGVWGEWPDGKLPIYSLGIPKFFSWGGSLTDSYTELNDSQWNSVPTNKHRAVFPNAAHWDYLPAGVSDCEKERGVCSLVGMVARDLVATFFGKHLPPECWPDLTTCIHDSLVAPPRIMTFEQEFYGGSHLMGLKLLVASKNCSVQLAWKTSGSSGSATIS